VRHVYMSQGAARLAGGWELQLGGQLDQLGHRADLTRVTGLSLAYLDLRSLFHQKLQSFLSLLATSLPCLKALDLSYNALDLYVPPTRRAGETLGRFLSSLPLLVRLDLRGNRLTGALPMLLLGPEAEAGAEPGLQAGIGPGLEFLCVAHCRLDRADLACLASLSQLSHLDLSGNKLLSPLLEVLPFPALPRLATLELADCGLDLHTVTTSLLPALQTCACLTTLNLRGNSVLRSQVTVRPGCTVLADTTEQYVELPEVWEQLLEPPADALEMGFFPL